VATIAVSRSQNLFNKYLLLRSQLLSKLVLCPLEMIKVKRSSTVATLHRKDRVGADRMDVLAGANLIGLIVEAR
jgi:hypothetical protein